LQLLAGILAGGANVAASFLRRACTLSALATVIAGKRGHKRTVLPAGDRFDEINVDGEHSSPGVCDYMLIFLISVYPVL